MIQLTSDAKVLFIRIADYDLALKTNPSGALSPRELFDLSVLAFDSAGHIIRMVNIDFDDARKLIKDTTQIAALISGSKQ